jgi:hypothetical protein
MDEITDGVSAEVAKHMVPDGGKAPTVSSVYTYDYLEKNKLAQRLPPGPDNKNRYKCLVCDEEKGEVNGKSSQNAVQHLLGNHLPRVPGEMVKHAYLVLRDKVHKEIEALSTPAKSTIKSYFGDESSTGKRKRAELNLPASEYMQLLQDGKDPSSPAFLRPLAIAMAEGMAATPGIKGTFAESDAVGRLIGFFDKRLMLPSARLVAQVRHDQGVELVMKQSEVRFGPGRSTGVVAKRRPALHDNSVNFDHWTASATASKTSMLIVYTGSLTGKREVEVVPLAFRPQPQPHTADEWTATAVWRLHFLPGTEDSAELDR